MMNKVGPILFALSLLTSPAWALFETDAELVKTAKIDMGEAIQAAIEQVPGKAVEAELEEEDNRTVFEVKIIDNQGNEREVYVDAQTGKVIKVDSELF